MASPIVLTATAAPGATPITFNATAAKNFASNYSKLGQGQLARKLAIVVGIIGLIDKLNNAGGANYTSNHSGLIQDTQVFTGAISNFDPLIARAVNDWNTGNAAAGTSTDVWSLMTTGKDLIELPDNTLERISAFLRAQMRT